MIIDMEHQVCDYICMWNGLEDVYRHETKNILPQYFFFGLSGFCNFVFLNFTKSPMPKLVYWNDGRPKKMYEFMSEKVGFSYSVMEGRTFSYTLAALKDQISNGKPVVIGALDMFYLAYLPKFYQTQHIPIHYVLAVGYDDSLGQIWLYDCGREGLQKLSYENLERAWNVKVEGLSQKNTLYKFDFGPSLNDIRSIFYASLEEKYKSNLYAPVNFVGVKGIRKLAKNIVGWEKELDAETYRRCLLHLVEYAGFPPSLPDKINLPEVRHAGARLEFAGLLKWAAKEYQQELFQLAAEDFEKSGQYIETLAYKVFDIAEGRQRMSGDVFDISGVSDILNEISSVEEGAFKKIEQSFIVAPSHKR